MARIAIERTILGAYCRRHHIKKLAFFGSVLRDDFKADSDVDVLVGFEPGQTPGLLRLVAMEMELSNLVGGRRVDMRTAEDLSRYFRAHVLASAELQYAAP